MSLSILKHEVNSGSSIHYDAGMRRYLETYMGWLRDHERTVTLPVDPHQAYKYEGDFYGLLQVLKIPQDQHWLVMRVNDLTNPMDFPQDIQGVMVPDSDVIGRIVQRYRSLTKKQR